MTQRRPPKLAEWLLRTSIRDGSGHAWADELNELYEEDVRASGAWAATRRYWYEAIVFVGLWSFHRLTGRHRRDRGRRRAGGGGYGSVAGIRHAWRALRRAPAFSLLAIGTIALSVGGASTIGGVLGSVLLSPLPYPDSQRLATVWQVPEGSDDHVNASAPLFQSWDSGLGVFDAVAAYQGPGWTTVAVGTQPERVPSVRVTTDFFRTVGVRPALGREFDETDVRGAAAAVIVSWRLWSRLGKGPGDIGTTVSMDEGPRVVVGVMPPGFEFIERGVDVWWPYQPEATATWGEWTLKVVARLAEGVDVAGAQTALSELQSSLLAEEPSRDILPSVAVRSLSDQIVGGVRAGLIATAVGGALALLIAAVNIGGLLLSRNVSRRPELAMMRALGAGKRQIAVHLVAQAVILTGAGVVLGIGLAGGLLDVTRGMLPTDFPRLREVTLNGWAVGAATVSAVVVSVAAGVLAVPWRDSGLPSRLRPERGNTRALGGILIAQISMTSVLLVIGALLGRSFLGLRARDPGIDPESVLAVELRLPASLSEDAEAARSFVGTVDRSVAVLPGVSSAGQIQLLPFAGGNWVSLLVDPEFPGLDPPLEGDVRVITPGYIETVRLPVMRGRAFNVEDRAEAPGVVLVNQVLAETVWPGEDPVGRSLIVDMFDGTERRVVGVVGSVLHSGLTTAPQPEVYVPYSQAPVAFSTLVVRGTTGSGLVEEVGRAVHAAEPSATVSRPIMLEALVDASIATERMYAYVFGTLSALALLLSGIGVFGVASFRVAQERHQLGLRAALGASPSRLRTRVLGEASVVVGSGLVVGLMASVLLRGTLSSLLFGVTEVDPLTYVTVTAVVAVLGLAASIRPALRAGKVDPMTSIREYR